MEKQRGEWRDVPVKKYSYFIDNIFDTAHRLITEKFDDLAIPIIIIIIFCISREWIYSWEWKREEREERKMKQKNKGRGKKR